ncbi:uncharacterized protein E0L32_012428, partial [Thyridium curvatum]
MELFVQLSDFPFVICRQCKIGVVTNEVKAHLKKQHGNISQQQARAYVQMAQAIPNAIHNQAKLKEWPYPGPETKPIPFIKPPKSDGLGCNSCRYVVRDTRQMQKHCEAAHSWSNNRRRGRYNQRAERMLPPVPWRTGVQCQQMFPNRAGSSWFEVGRGQAVSRQAQADSPEQELAAFITQIHQEEEQAFEAEAKSQMHEADDKWEADRWLRRCGWSRHLANTDQERLRGMLQPIDDAEVVLQQMWQSLDRVLDSAYTAATQCHQGSAELFEVERKETTITPSKPFQPLMEPDSWGRYKEVWKKLLAIWQRMESWDERDRAAESSTGVHGSDGDDGDEDDGDSSTANSDEEEGNSSTTSSPTSSPAHGRPEYRMTIQQARAWQRFMDGINKVIAGEDTRPSEAETDRMCLDTIVEFLDHPFKNGNHYESIIISALAVMGLDPCGGWVRVVNYTPIYSVVTKVGRYLVLYQSMLEREAWIQRRQRGTGCERQEAEEKVDGLFKIVRRKVRRFMTRIPDDEEAEPTPMNWIINTRTYGMHIRYTTPGSEAIDWRGDEIIHGHVRLGMGRLSDMMHSLLQEARRTMAGLTMIEGGGQEPEVDIRGALPRIPWHDIEDRHGESALGHAFLNDEANEAWTKAGHGWVMKQILGSTARQERWITQPANKDCPYKERAIRDYEQAVERFRGQIWVLMHMLGGQPARSTEILGLRMWNTANGGVRNIFVHKGMVCFVTMYHKGFRRTDTIKVIHRYLPREVGELLVWYMWLVLPFWQQVQGRIKQQHVRSAFLWADQVVSRTGSKEGRVREVHTRQAGRGDVDSGHVNGNGVSSHINSSSDARDEPDEGPEQEQEEAAFMEWFRESKWTSDRVTRAMQRYSVQFSGQELKIGAWRHIAIGIANRYFNKAFGPHDGAGDGDGGADDDGDGSLVDSIYDLQAGHGSHIAGLVYARMFGQGDLGTMRSREQFRKVSMQWHRFFGFGAEDGPGPATGAGVKRVRMAFDDERDDMRFKRFKQLHRADLHGQLKQMLGPTAEFRGLQEPVIQAVVRGEWPIVQITPTGGGKSLTFMLPAFCTPDGVTVVVTPLVALQDDMVDRCRRHGIDAYVWKSRGPQRAAALVFVTPESAAGQGFREFVERMRSQHRLDRVVVDECHTLLQHTKTFRPQMARLGGVLQDIGLPVVCLTATLKPGQEQALAAKLGFRHERLRIFREATTRRNIEYSIDIIREGPEADTRAQSRAGTMNTSRKRRVAPGRVNVEGEEVGEADEAVEERVCEVVRRWTDGQGQGKVIVYGGTIARVERIAVALGCTAHWRGVGNAEEKARQIQAWRQSTGGPSGWIVATNALGLGIDEPDVGLVVHAGMPRRLEDFAQESGRGGRGGQKSMSVVVIRQSWLDEQQGRRRWRRQGRQGQQQGGEGEQQACGWDEDTVEYAAGERCRRDVLDQEMDGRTDRIGCAEDEEACDICQQRSQAWQQQAQQEQADETDGKESTGSAERCYQHSQQKGQQAQADRTRQVMTEACEVQAFEDMEETTIGDMTEDIRQHPEGSPATRHMPSEGQDGKEEERCMGGQRREGQGRAVQEVTDDERAGPVGADDGRGRAVQGVPGAGHQGDIPRHDADRADHGHRRRQEFVVHVARVLQRRRRGDDRGRAVGGVAAGFIATVPGARDRHARMDGAGGRAGGGDRVGDARVGQHEGVPQ